VVLAGQGNPLGIVEMLVSSLYCFPHLGELGPRRDIAEVSARQRHETLSLPSLHQCLPARSRPDEPSALFCGGYRLGTPLVDERRRVILGWAACLPLQGERYQVQVMVKVSGVMLY